jgi:hypothetical protein
MSLTCELDLELEKGVCESGANLIPCLRMPVRFELAHCPLSGLDCR